MAEKVCLFYMGNRIQLVSIFASERPATGSSENAARLGTLSRFERVVIEASAVARQRDLISALRDRACEIILDTNAAPVVLPGRYDGVVKTAPWALGDSLSRV